MFIEEIKRLSNNTKYVTWYCDIVKKAQARVSKVKKSVNKKKLAVSILRNVEVHHIVPRALKSGWAKDKNNLVYLSLREHFICHILLPRMLVNREHRVKMLYAVRRLNNKHQYNSLTYESLKTQYKIAHGLKMLQLWKDPDYVAKHKKAVDNGKYTEAHNEANRQKALKEMQDPKRRTSFVKSGLDAGKKIRDKDKEAWVSNSMGSTEGRAKAKKAHKTQSHREFCRKRELSKTKEVRIDLAKKGQQALVDKCGGQEGYVKMLRDRMKGRKKYINTETLQVKITREPILGWMLVTEYNKRQRVGNI